MKLLCPIILRLLIFVVLISGCSVNRYYTKSPKFRYTAQKSLDDSLKIVVEDSLLTKPGQKKLNRGIKTGLVFGAFGLFAGGVALSGTSEIYPSKTEGFIRGAVPGFVVGFLVGYIVGSTIGDHNH